jgi:hypothetical protein
MTESMRMSETHAFRVDSIVYFRASGKVADAFKVVKHLPVERGGPQYRIRSEATGQERVADEALLVQA